MEKLNAKMIVHHLNQFVIEDLQRNQLYLWVWHADKIPPHIGCSINGSYFSLKANGTDLNLPITQTMALINKKQIPSLLIAVDKNLSEEALKTVYSIYSKAEANFSTCLTPLLDLFENPKDVKQLSTFLHYLSKEGLLKSIFGLHLNSDYNGLPEYTIDAINERLQKLNDVKRKNSIS